MPKPDRTNLPPVTGELKISDLSRLTGVPVTTLRFWSESGLLAPLVTPTGYRIYDESHIQQALDIKRLRTLQGLSITAIKATMSGSERGPSPLSFSDVASTPQDPTDNPIGERLRSLRKAEKLTIRDVAEKVGISARALGSIERTSLGMHIPEAKALATFFGVTLTSLMAPTNTHSNKARIVGAEGGEILPTLGRGLRIEQLATGRDMMDCQRWYIDAGVNSHGAYSHDGEEFVYVLMGEFEITINVDQVHRLRQGESIYFKSTWKHSWVNPGKATTVLLWVNTPPTF
jgi:DNA-binding transcriptional MerR regulator/mannose-6-phosphate isomerase-like protein (cupin superfamily)